MTGWKVFLLITLSFCSISVFAQKIHIKASNEPLSSVVKRLDAEVSFDNKVLSAYKVTVDKSFSSTYKAIVYLISGKPLEVREVSGVYIISAKQKGEDLKHLQEKTKFKNIFKDIPDTSPVNLSLSLNEIVITAKNHIPSLRGEEADGTIRFNSFTANAMPGYSDNLVFNVLRMMPGIRAGGEPSDQLYVWGSSPGESRISFDGIPLFTTQSYNSNISYINPYMFNEVRYKRGVLSAADESQTGAKVEVISGMSQIEKPVFKAMLSTVSTNCYSAIPIGNKCILSIAYRHTLDGLFGLRTFDVYRSKGKKEHTSNSPNTKAISEYGNNVKDSLSSNSATSTITPKFQFQDINVNVTGIGSNNLTYRITLYGAKDFLKYSSSDSLTAFGKQTCYQGGMSAYIDKTWQNGNRSELSSFFSGLHTTQNGSAFNVSSDMEEKVSEYNARLQQIGVGENKGISFGGEFIAYRVNSSLVTQTAIQPTLFATQKFSKRGLNMEAGLRTDIMSNGVKWQPRFLLKYHFLKSFTFTSAWGIYNQYLVEDPFSVTEGQYQFRWDINKSLKSQTTVAGIAFDKDGLNISVEAYMKNIHNSRWVLNSQLGKYNFDLKGIDVSAKYNWQHGLFFTSWSLAKDPRQTEGTSNEIKAASIFRFFPITFSANYVFSTGYNSLLLPTNSYKLNGEKKETEYDTSTTYSRMDLSASYEKRFKKFGITTGLSLINIFDTSNKKCITTWIPRDFTSSFYAQAARFTPIIFIEIKL